MKLGATVAAAAFLAGSLAGGAALAGDGLDRHGLDHYRNHHWWGGFTEPAIDCQPPVAEFYAYRIPRGVLYNGPPPMVAHAAYRSRDVIRAKY